MNAIAIVLFLTLVILREISRFFLMKISIYFFGKKGEVTDIEEILLKRINFRQKCELVSIAQSGIRDGKIAKEEEGKKFLEKIEKKSGIFLIAMDEHGVEQDSRKFSGFLEKKMENFSEIVFVIGGAHGLGQNVLARADMKLCFGRMVWTRNLFRVMLLEQVYRALEISGGSNFHKD